MKEYRKMLVAGAAAMSLLLTGCGGMGGSGGMQLDLFDTSSDDEYSDASSDVTSGSGSAAADRGLFGDSGTIMSMDNGELNISRLTRANEKPMGGDDWTVLVYMCGTDLESENYAATIDIVEAIEGSISNGVNIIFQTGGTNGWYENIISSDKLQRYAVIEDDITLVDEKPLKNMGDPSTLSDFIEWGAENYPADNMGLVFWNHGGGSISGVCFDEMYDSDSLSLTEIDRALSDSFDAMTEKFEFIGFDACLMATLETANVLAPYARYMYASEETEPGGGWNYTALADYLVSKPDCDGALFGKALCDSYFDHSADSGMQSEVTLSVIDLSKMDALVKSFNATAKQMYESGSFNSIVKSVVGADNFGGNNRNEGYTNMVDLKSMLESVQSYCPNASETVRLLDDAVVYKINGYMHSGAGGLSVYYPLSVQGSQELSVFGDICPSTYYLAFVDKAAYGTTGYDVGSYDNTDILGNWDDIWDIDYDYGDYSTNTDSFANIGTSTVPVDAVYFDEEGIYTVALSDISNLNYASCSLFLEDTDGSSIYLGSDDEVTYDWDKLLIKDNFDGSWISLDDGQPLPIDVVDQTYDYSTYTCSVLLNGEYTNLRIEYDWNAEKWSVLGAWDGIDPETGMAAREVVQLQNGDVIQPVYYYIYGDSTDYFCGDEYVVRGEIGLSYQYLPAADYSYSITLYDIYGNWYFTPSVTFTIEADGSLTFYPDELSSSDDSGYEDIFGFDYGDDLWYDQDYGDDYGYDYGYDYGDDYGYDYGYGDDYGYDYNYGYGDQYWDDYDFGLDDFFW